MLPGTITQWERSLRAFSEKIGGQAVPPDWKLPILYKMIPTSMMQEIKIRHKYATGEVKAYAGFSRLLIEMAYNRRAAKGWGESDMDVDAMAAEKLAHQAK